MSNNSSSDKYLSDFSTQEKADSFLLSQMDETFQGKKFKVISHSSDDYALTKNNGSGQGVLEAYVEDQNGIKAYVEANSNAKGLGNLQGGLITDYMQSYYMPQLAEPIEKILNQFSFIQNYSVGLAGQIGKGIYDNNLHYTIPQFFENIKARYGIYIIVDAKTPHDELAKQIYQVYDALYKQQVQFFDFGVVASVKYNSSHDKLGGGSYPCELGESLYDTGYVDPNSHQEKPYVDFFSDFNIEVGTSQTADNLPSYGVVWKINPAAAK